jgi:hypothetical protein
LVSLKLRVLLNQKRKRFYYDLGIAINARQRPTLIQATRAATAFTTGIALPGGYTYVIWFGNESLF